MRSDEDYWFEPKRYGYGAGWPRSWQAWAITWAYSLTIIASAWFVLPRSVAAFLVVTTGATAALLVVAARKTRGGWRWRWGDRER
jgi:hypothetical protein